MIGALGLNSCDILAAAAYRFSGNIDAEQLLGSQNHRVHGRISRLMEDLLHADGEAKVVGDEEDDGEWY